MKIYKRYSFLLLILIIVLIFATSIVSATNSTITSNSINDTSYDNEYNKTLYSNEIANSDNSIITTNLNTQKTDKQIKTAQTKENIYVSSNGLEKNNGTNQNNPTTLQHALNNIKDNTTIILTSKSNTDVYNLTSVVNIRSFDLSDVHSLEIIADTNNNITFNGLSKTSLLNIYGLNVTIRNINFNNSYSTSNAAIQVNQANVTIENCSFTNNKGDYYSSAIYLTSSKVIINSSVFNNNQATYGTVYANNANLTIENSSFNNNKAGYGGSLFLFKSNGTLNNNTFINNKATDFGGSIVQLDGNYLKINNSSFKSNNATYGGAIYNMYGLININNSILEYNNANSGESVYSYNSSVTVKKSVLLSKLNNSLIYLVSPKKYDFDENWWGVNNPDFMKLTNGLIPNSWILMEFKSVKNNTQLISLNTLSNNKTTNLIHSRNITIKENSNILNKTTITNTTTINLDNFTNITAIIDNQSILLDSKIIPNILSKNYTAISNSVVSINIQMNKDITGTINITFNNKTYKQTAKENIIYSLNISSLKEGNYPFTVTYNGNNKYNITNKTYYITIQSTTYDKSNNITPNRIYNTTSVVIPSYYNLNDLNQTTSVKTQGSSGSCITFAAMGALESSIKKVTNITYDLSENNLKNIFKRYSIFGYPDLEPNDGGYDLEPIGYFVGGYGPVLESTDKYSTRSYLSEVYQSDIQVQNIYFIPARNNYTDNDLIKEAIMKYGGVFTSLYSSSQLNIYNSYTEANHVVLIVGWDDNYSKNNFNNAPPADGAFIIKNSWGTATGNKGYQYVSYYDSIIGNLIYVGNYNNVNFAIDYNNLYNYSNIYQYDTVSYIYDVEDTSGEYSIKNVYKMNNTECISAIGTYFINKSNYTIDLLINGNKVCRKTGTVDYPGYRTIYLDNFYRVNSNDEVVVIINIKQNINSKYIYIPLQDNDYPTYTSKNISFISFDGQKTWDDLYDYSSTVLIAPIKVYTMNLPKINSTLTYSNDTISITTTISNINSSAKLYYKLNNEYLYNANGKIISYNIDSSKTITLKNSTLGLTNGNYILQTVLVYDDINITQNNNFKIQSNNITLKVSNLTQYVNETKTLTVTVTNSQNQSEKINQGIIYVKYSNGTVITSSKVTNSQALLNITIKKGGNYTITIEYSNSTKYSTTYTKINVIIKKINTKITVSAKNTYVYNNSLITGKLTDNTNNPINNTKVNITVNGKTYQTTTNKTGEYKLNYNNTIIGINTVIVTFNQNDYYNSSTKTTTYKTSIMPTTVKVTKVIGTIGEKITLTSTVVDINNKPVQSGYVIFKINGITVKDNGQINGSSNPLKVYVKNGIATTNITAYLNIRYGKNLTSVYSGNTYYNASRSNTATAEIQLRKAQIVVKTNITKTTQDTYIKFTATIYDITNGVRTNIIHNLPEQYVYFKVNGITIKNSDLTAYQVKIVNGVATYNYKIPIGFMGITDAKTFNTKNHTVTAGLYNKNYLPDAVNYTYFQVERSDVTINITKVVVNNKTHKISITATMKDYHNNYLIGTNKIIIKINGITLTQTNGNPQYFMIEDGRITLSNISIPSYNKYTTLTIVTQDRLGYKSARATSTTIQVNN